MGRRDDERENVIPSGISRSDFVSDLVSGTCPYHVKAYTPDTIVARLEMT